MAAYGRPLAAGSDFDVPPPAGPQTACHETQSMAGPASQLELELGRPAR